MQQKNENSLLLLHLQWIYRCCDLSIFYFFIFKAFSVFTQKRAFVVNLPSLHNPHKSQISCYLPLYLSLTLSIDKRAELSRFWIFFYRLHFALFVCIVHSFKGILNFCCHNAALMPITLCRQPKRVAMSLEISIKNEWLHFAIFTLLSCLLSS